MAVDFSFDRWDQIKETYRRWWACELNRPILGTTLHGRDPGRPEPALPAQGLTALYDLTIPAEKIVDRWDYHLSARKFLGDAFPHVWPNFGPGVIAAFMGAKPAPDGRTCWFEPAEDLEIADIHFHYDPDNAWLKRVKDTCQAAMDRWEGMVQVSMTDLGGNMDILSTFRPAERILLDLYDHPEEVRRVLFEAHEMWHRYYREINDICQPANPGYSAWAGIFSPEPYYMLQSDFCYMIGTPMFDEFVKPELAASCKRLTNSFYHLDGVGALPHLDSLLEIDQLGGVQWVPGTGKPGCAHWIDVYRKIIEADKLVQILDPSAVDPVARETGRPEKILCHWGRTMDHQGESRKMLKKYGAI